ncbi:hypothetical protein VOLCADRAFT_93857 [Volvox carteri f. nagariensis]|uniref:Peptidase M43 pregnancy-associated plasma-A domain-containing protein n=1 Tax=Volvox carteri f. nagariensis TaxID=3068 RepID=D8U389_VOLCA|nr:uncharacterized protein VOLCADRAFT_93857 [Volvox carteri f. nagariensis]EFJ45784.1 hypothetical protein VOLCADRAFT_93857 [Volvox carteri f. nagariensis]|eukprot:XP_002953185.1 hypothetical protein VOLCADRAFT_93857 [Volvox carteri f. nagariensis]
MYIETDVYVSHRNGSNPHELLLSIVHIFLIPALWPWADIKVVPEADSRPFLALKDPINAGSEDVQRLYEQASQVSAIAYLLFAAARPLSEAPGSSNALLPYLTPTLLRLYTSQPGRCSSTLTRQLYDLSLKLYGTTELQSCHYDLYTSLGAAFSWVRDNIPLRLQEVPGQPLASAAWPDMSRTTPLKLAARVAEALLPNNSLGDTASQLNASCGLPAADFASAVPNISTALQRLHADLPLIQGLAGEMHSARWAPDHPDVDERRRALLEQRTGGYINPQLHIASELDTADADGSSSRGIMISDNDDILNNNDDDIVAHGDESTHRFHRRSAATLPSNFFYSLPPANFVLLPPGKMSQLMVPLVFHIMLYQDGRSIGPARYDQSLQYVQRMVQVTNIMAKPSSVQFFVKEVRNDPATYPYLLLSDRATWLQVPLQNCTGPSCFSNATFMSTSVWDFPRSVNVFIASDSTVGVPLGYAYIGGPKRLSATCLASQISKRYLGNARGGASVIMVRILRPLKTRSPLYSPVCSCSLGSDIQPYTGHVFVSWDSLSFDGANSITSYDDGPNTLLHELFHHLGLQHPFQNSYGALGQCVDGDDVIDTPASLRPISSSNFFATAQAYCMELFWGQYGGDWDAAYVRWSSTLGIPESDMNAWADSCPALPGYDELGNYMTYNTPVCFAALGHFTPAQVQRAMLMTSEVNPLLYAWGQYYAQNAAPPPPQRSPPPVVVNNTCRSTAKSACPCKSEWQLGGNTYFYCDRTGTNNTLTCEVADPITCADCTSQWQCILPCAARLPPPPPPRPPSPPPMPPPPPPRSVPSECMKSRTGCACRSTWNYQGAFYSYCASPDGSENLWCQVSSSCPSFSNNQSYQNCLPGLNESYCGGRVYFSSTRVPPRPPRPPLPPPDLRPRPPPGPPTPTDGPIATITGRITINASCALLSTNGSALQSNLLAELSQTLQVPLSYVKITGMACGSILAYYSVAFPTGATIEQINSVAQAASALSFTVSIGFASRWGSVTQSSSDVNVLQPSASSTSSYKWIAIGVIVGVAILAIVAVLVALVIYSRIKNGRVAPQAQYLITAAFTTALSCPQAQAALVDATPATLQHP